MFLQAAKLRLPSLAMSAPIISNQRDFFREKSLSFLVGYYSMAQFDMIS
jgi:hypothetical protein